jgi:hypothetical protein
MPYAASEIDQGKLRGTLYVTKIMIGELGKASPELGIDYGSLEFCYVGY